MSRFSNPVPQFLDGNGVPVPGGKVFFFETGTTTLKNTFSDAALTIANSNPVILDANGRAPDIHLSGTYKVVLKDANEVELWSRDPIATGSDSQGQPWVNDKTYSLADFVTGSDFKFYKSRVADNQGNNPVSSPTQWKLILELSEFPVNGGVKMPCRLATTTNITLSGLQTLGGTQGLVDDRVIVKDQTNGAENGIYLMKSGAWERAADWDSASDVDNGILVVGTEGISAGIWQASYTGTFTLGTTTVTFTGQTSGGAAAATAQALLALGYKNDAETAKTASETARTGAETAKTASETAQTAAETAKTAAETAKTVTETARNAAQTAQANAEKVNLGEFTSDPTADNAGGALVAGKHFYYNSSTKLVRIYTSVGWQNATASVSGVRETYTYTATANQIVFSGADIDGKTLSIDDASLVDVFYGGVRLKDSERTISAAGNSVTLTTGAVLNAEVNVTVFGDYSAQAGSNVNITGGNISGVAITGYAPTNNATLTGNTVIPAGITLGVSSYNASNTLDDYEEGTWTPSIGTNAGNKLSTSSTAYYTKIGRLVYVNVDLTNNTGASGNQIFDLPFAVSYPGAGAVGWQNTAADISMYVDAGNNSLYIIAANGSTSANIQNGERIILSATYIT